MGEVVGILAWNVHDGFGDPKRQDGVVGVVGHMTNLLWLDVGVFPEAFSPEQADVANHAVRSLEDMGYVVKAVPNDDDDGRRDRHSTLMIAERRMCQNMEAIRLAGRSAIKGTLRGGQEVYGVHGNDRRAEARARDMGVLLSHIRPGVPAAIAGDFNAMHYGDPRAWLYRAAGPLVRCLPEEEPRPEGSRSPIGRFGSLAIRLSGMANDNTLKMLRDAGYEDASLDNAGSRYEPTMRRMGGLLAAQLDHIMVSDGVASKFFMTFPPFRGLSDHQAIYAYLEM